ncbi:DUF4442 domain-containing protein [uncultured Apibacter sp.]|uniref:DUF4442 domain-containing protein n=1 Tax=uncultured Apibacter sp. TaxID=1778616 RepID=UPI0025FCCBF7|nr:DUF4442 domain-containing protein [uncultured Apibacter sp.]
MYKKINKFLSIVFKPSIIYKYFFNISPLYIRTTGNIKYVSEDVYKIIVEIPLSYKNRNYAGTMFGGSILSATDPIYMLQLIHILGSEYIIWDKSVSAEYIKPINQKAIAIFEFQRQEIEQIKESVKKNNEITLNKKLHITNKLGNVFCYMEKIIYIADKNYYKEKVRNKNITIHKVKDTVSIL